MAFGRRALILCQRSCDLFRDSIHFSQPTIAYITTMYAHLIFLFLSLSFILHALFYNTKNCVSLASCSLRRRLHDIQFRSFFQRTRRKIAPNQDEWPRCSVATPCLLHFSEATKVSSQKNETKTSKDRRLR